MSGPSHIRGGPLSRVHVRQATTVTEHTFAGRPHASVRARRTRGREAVRWWRGARADVTMRPGDMSGAEPGTRTPRVNAHRRPGMLAPRAHAHAEATPRVTYAHTREGRHRTSVLFGLGDRFSPHAPTHEAFTCASRTRKREAFNLNQSDPAKAIESFDRLHGSPLAIYCGDRTDTERESK